MVVNNSAMQQEWETVRARVESRLAELVSEGPSDSRLSQSIRHSLLAPGKRLRPMMTVLAATGLGAGSDAALDPACAIEMVHTASLIVDDLPFMDDAALRRGRRTSHGRFGVEIAVLAAVSLLNRAPTVIARSTGIEESVRLELIGTLSAAVGDTSGLTAGQLGDLMAQHETADLGDLERIVRHKTGALFVCAAETGARIAGADLDTVCGLRQFAMSFGLAFQALDDLADLRASAGEASKDFRQDARKLTFATLLGAEGAREAARRHADEALAALATVGLGASSLAELANEALVVSQA